MDACKHAYHGFKSRYIGNLFIIYQHSPPYSHKQYDYDILNQSDKNSNFQLTVGPHWYGAVMTLVVIYAAVSLYIHVIEGITNLPLFVKSSLIIIELILAFCTLTFFLLTALLDPGVVRSTNDSQLPSHDEASSPWCDICNIARRDDLRIRHCYDCDVCIEGVDHHCPWIGKCIGKKNMRWFILFNISWILGVINLVIVAFSI